MGPISKHLVLFLGLSLSAMAFDGPAPGKENISVTATGTPSSFVNNVNVIFGNLLFALNIFGLAFVWEMSLVKKVIAVMTAPLETEGEAGSASASLRRDQGEVKA